MGPFSILRIRWHHCWMGSCNRCAHLTKALALAPESLRFQGSRQIGIDTCMANGTNICGNTTARRNQPSLPVSQALAPCARQPGFRPSNKTFSSLQSLRRMSQDMRSENHCTSPSLLCMTHQSESVVLPGQSTPSIETPKVKNPNPMLHLIQHHLALLHASSRGNYRFGSSDLLDFGGWVPRSLQVHHQWCTGGQRGVHPWDHNDSSRGHFHKKL